MNVIDLRDRVAAGAYEVAAEEVAEAMLRCLRRGFALNPTALAEELWVQLDHE